MKSGFDKSKGTAANARKDAGANGGSNEEGGTSVSKRFRSAPGNGGRVVRSLLTAAIVGGLYFYILLPPLNPMSGEFYAFLIVVLVAALLGFGSRPPEEQSVEWDDAPGSEPLFVVVGGRLRINLNRFFRPRSTRRSSGRMHPWQKLLAGALAAVGLACVLGNVSSMVIFHAGAYRDLLDVQTGDFASEVSEVSYNRIPMLDLYSAIQLGRRALGNISSNSNLVSQFEVSDAYSQINYRGEPVRVSPLEYGNLIKWFNNRAEGIPAYVVVNMVSQETRLVQLEEGMRYTTSEHFGRNLYRFLRFQYPTMMFGDVNFEIDDDGQPWWVCSREVHTIGLFGGVDVRGAVMVNAVTGEHQYYEEVPSWVDRVYSANLLVEQYNYHGTLVSGWLNSWLGQKGVTITTDGYNYIALNDDVYMYTGVTSAGSDESNVGFILVNQRTKEARFYHVTGAEEYSAMSSAEGAVQHLNYSATFPILLNISDEPTYFMALKDGAQLVKMYAMVNVGDYQITATGSTVKACQSAYEQLLEENGIIVTDHVEEEPTELESVTGVIADLRSAVINGNTVYFLALQGQEGVYYSISASQEPMAVLLNPGQEVTLGYIPGESGSILEAQSLTLTPAG